MKSFFITYSFLQHPDLPVQVVERGDLPPHAVVQPPASVVVDEAVANPDACSSTRPQLGCVSDAPQHSFVLVPCWDMSGTAPGP